MYVPNVFSPNQDGINDIFKPSFSNIGDISGYQFQIFDRWGSLLFETRDPTVGWNGRAKERVLNPGVYVWRMEGFASGCAGSRRLKETGTITLLR